uniref:Protein kinase domain-containing protein n=1 Tax=Zea mays TaxID=4577 RepID=A0A804PRC7_MAIZE
MAGTEAEWKTLYSLGKNGDGLLRKHVARSVYDGTLFSRLAPRWKSPVEVLEAYEGTLEDDYPPENERYEHNEMLLYKMTTAISIEDVRREVKILKALFGHSNLVKFYDACEDALNVYIIMDTLTLYMVAGHSGHKLNQELHSARFSFEQARFNLVTSLSHVEAKKRYEFLEAVSATMDSDLRYFKQGYELLHQMEPYINQ